MNMLKFCKPEGVGEKLFRFIQMVNCNNLLSLVCMYQFECLKGSDVGEAELRRQGRLLDDEIECLAKFCASKMLLFVHEVREY